MRYLQLKNKIRSLESSTKTCVYNSRENRASVLGCKVSLSNEWLDCYMYLCDLRGSLVLNEDRDPLYFKLREIRKLIGLMR